MDRLRNYIIQSRLELAKVIFPTKEQVRTAFFTVVAVVAIIAAFLAIVDALMSFVVSHLV